MTNFVSILLLNRLPFSEIHPIFNYCNLWLSFIRAIETFQDCFCHFHSKEVGRLVYHRWVQPNRVLIGLDAEKGRIRNHSNSCANQLVQPLLLIKKKAKSWIISPVTTENSWDARKCFQPRQRVVLTSSNARWIRPDETNSSSAAYWWTSQRAGYSRNAERSRTDRGGDNREVGKKNPSNDFMSTKTNKMWCVYWKDAEDDPVVKPLLENDIEVHKY